MSTMHGLLLLQLVCLSIVSVCSVPTDWQDFTSITTWVIPFGYTQYPAVRTAYRLYRDKRSWSGAKKACIADGARLAIINSWEKLEIIETIKRPDDVVWVGIKYKHGSWYDAANHRPEERVLSIPWAPGNPDEFGNCVAVMSGMSGLGNKFCFWWQPFVCELRSDPE